MLLIEVADSSLAFDLGRKRDLYARFGVSEYWVADLVHDHIVMHRSVFNGEFQRNESFKARETISPWAFPGLQLIVDELLGI
jgi:Uma2 family endonuclease